jgi:hypothetical protein
MLAATLSELQREPTIMAMREKLVQRAQPYLQPGERIQSIFLAQTGPSPYWLFLSVWIVVFSAGYSTVVVTDRAIVVLQNGRLTGTRAKGVRLRGPRNAWLGQPRGMWGSIQLDKKYWVHKRFHKDVRAADAALAEMNAQQGVLPPAPQSWTH